MNGTLVAPGFEKFLSGEIGHAINLDENMVLRTGDAWTDTTGNNGAKTSPTCSSWVGGGEPQGKTGAVEQTGASWSESNSRECSMPARLYCFEQ